MTDRLLLDVGGCNSPTQLKPPMLKLAADTVQPPGENYANPRTCFFHVLSKATTLTFYILSTLFISNFFILFVVTILHALDFWVVKSVSESVWKIESLDQE